MCLVAHCSNRLLEFQWLLNVFLSWQICSCIVMKSNSFRSYCLIHRRLAASFNFTFRYIDDYISINNRWFNDQLTLFTPWTGNQRDHWNFFLRFLFRFIIFLSIKVVWQMWRLRISHRKLPLHLQQYTRVSTLWCLYLVTYKIRQSLFFVMWFYRQREATR